MQYSRTMSEHLTLGNWILSMMVCSLKMCSNDAPSLQPWPDTSTTWHGPGCSLLILPDVVADPWVWGQLQLPPTLWKSLGSTHLCFPLHYASKAKLSYGANLHLSVDCSERLLRSLGKKIGGLCCDFVKSGLGWVKLLSLHRKTLDQNRQSLTPGFTMKISPFFEHLQFPINILA